MIKERVVSYGKYHVREEGGYTYERKSEEDKG